MRSILLTMLTSAALAGSAACGDDTTTSDAGGDTIDDTNQPVDSADSTATNDDASTEPGDTIADSTSPPDATVTDTIAETDGSPAPIIVVINEVSADGDWVELYNAGTTEADIGGYAMRDDNIDPLTEFVIPAGTKIPPGAYELFGQDETGVTGFSFGLGDQDAVFLYDRSGTVKSTAAWNIGQAPALATWGRFPNGTGPLKTLYIPTPEEANVDNPPATCGNDLIELGELCDGTDLADGVECTDWGWGGGTLGCTACKSYSFTGCTERTGGLVINEVTSDIDRIEIYNGSPALIALQGYQIRDEAGNAWPFPARSIPGRGAGNGGFIVLTRDAVGEFTFGIGNPDTIFLLDKNGNEIDRVTWLEDEAEISYCRSPNGTGGFKECETATFGTANP